MGNVHMEARDINYRGGQKKMSVEEALKNTSGEAAAIAQLQRDVADLNDTKANLITIAPVFSAETAYDPGDLVYHNGLTYRCVNSHEGEWDADDFAATTISNELSSLESGLTSIGGRFAVVEGTNAAAVEQFTTLPMPSGFDAYNTVILGYTAQYSNDLWYSSNSGVYVDANGANVFVTVKDAGFASRPVKVVLYKFA